MKKKSKKWISIGLLIVIAIIMLILLQFYEFTFSTWVMTMLSIIFAIIFWELLKKW